MEDWDYNKWKLYPKYRWINCLPDTIYDDYNDVVAYWMHRYAYQQFFGATTEEWKLVSKDEMQSSRGRLQLISPSYKRRGWAGRVVPSCRHAERLS